MLKEIEDLKTSVKASLGRLNTAIEGVAGDVAGLKKKIDDLLAGGTLGADDRAALLEIQADAAAAADKLAAIDAQTEPENPVPPTVPPA